MPTRPRRARPDHPDHPEIPEAARQWGAGGKAPRASAASLVLQAGGGLGRGGDGGLDLLGASSGVEPRGMEGERLRGKLGRRAEVEARTLVARG